MKTVADYTLSLLTSYIKLLILDDWLKIFASLPIKLHK